MKVIASSMWRYWNATSKAEAIRYFNNLSRRWKNVLRGHLSGRRYE